MQIGARYIIWDNNMTHIQNRNPPASLTSQKKGTETTRRGCLDFLTNLCLQSYLRRITPPLSSKSTKHNPLPPAFKSLSSPSTGQSSLNIRPPPRECAQGMRIAPKVGNYEQYKIHRTCFETLAVRCNMLSHISHGPLLTMVFRQASVVSSQACGKSRPTLGISFILELLPTDVHESRMPLHKLEHKQAGMRKGNWSVSPRTPLHMISAYSCTNFNPFWTASSFTSTITLLNLLRAAQWAMPDPMTPAPMTAAGGTPAHAKPASQKSCI